MYAQIWDDLQITGIPEASIDATKTDLESFLMGIYFLKCYPNEAQLSAIFKICEKTAQKWGWFFARKIQALKKEKVSR